MLGMTGTLGHNYTCESGTFGPVASILLPEDSPVHSITILQRSINPQIAALGIATYMVDFIVGCTDISIARCYEELPGAVWHTRL
jgi:hypothetical protein